MAKVPRTETHPKPFTRPLLHHVNAQTPPLALLLVHGLPILLNKANNERGAAFLDWSLALLLHLSHHRLQVGKALLHLYETVVFL